jgi:hypothetical protein
MRDVRAFLESKNWELSVQMTWIASCLHGKLPIRLGDLTAFVSSPALRSLLGVTPPSFWFGFEKRFHPL